MLHKHTLFRGLATGEMSKNHFLKRFYDKNLIYFMTILKNFIFKYYVSRNAVIFICIVENVGNMCDCLVCTNLGLGKRSKQYKIEFKNINICRKEIQILFVGQENKNKVGTF